MFSLNVGDSSRASNDSTSVPDVSQIWERVGRSRPSWRPFKPCVFVPHSIYLAIISSSASLGVHDMRLKYCLAYSFRSCLDLRVQSSCNRFIYEIKVYTSHVYMYSVYTSFYVFLNRLYHKLTYMSNFKKYVNEKFISKYEFSRPDSPGSDIVKYFTNITPRVAC